MDTIPKQKDIYRSTRILYLLEAAFENFISILISGVYLAKLTTSIGVSDSMTAVLSSISSLAGMFQLISIFLSHKTPFKRWIVPSQFFASIMYGFLYLIPFLNLGRGSSILFFVVILLAHVIKNVLSPIKVTWFLSLVDDKKRGEFSSLVSIVSRIGHIGFVFAVGLVIDMFEKKNDLRSAFIILTVIIFVLSVFNIFTLLFSKEKKVELPKKESPFKSVRTLFKNRKFLRIIILYTFYSFSTSLISSFLGTYQIKELGFSMTFVAILDTVVTTSSIPVLFICGKISRKVSYVTMLYLSYIMIFIEYIILIFTSPANGMILYTTYRMLAIFSGSMQIVVATNIVFDVVPYTERASALSLKTIFVGATGFITTLIVSPFVSYVQKNGNSFLGINAYAQQILAFAAAASMLCLIIYFQFGCKKMLLERRDSNL